MRRRRRKENEGRQWRKGEGVGEVWRGRSQKINP